MPHGDHHGNHKIPNNHSTNNNHQNGRPGRMTMTRGKHVGAEGTLKTVARQQSVIPTTKHENPGTDFRIV